MNSRNVNNCNEVSANSFHLTGTIFRGDSHITFAANYLDMNFHPLINVQNIGIRTGNGGTGLSVRSNIISTPTAITLGRTGDDASVAIDSSGNLNISNLNTNVGFSIGSTINANAEITCPSLNTTSLPASTVIFGGNINASGINFGSNTLSNYSSSGLITTTWSGPWASSSSQQFLISRIGNMCSLYIHSVGASTVTSNTNISSSVAIPSGFRPINDTLTYINFPCFLTLNGTPALGAVNINPNNGAMYISLVQPATVQTTTVLGSYSVQSGTSAGTIPGGTTLGWNTSIHINYMCSLFP